MRITISTAIIAAVALTTLPSSAQSEPAEEQSVEKAAGWGNETCDALVEEYGKLDLFGQKVLEYGVAQWALGYMTKINLGTDNKKDLLSMPMPVLGRKVVLRCGAGNYSYVYDAVENIYKNDYEALTSPSAGA